MKFAYFLFFALLALGIPAEKANAFSRYYQPLNVAVVQADAIVIARPVRVPERYLPPQVGNAQIKIERVLKGSLQAGDLMVELPDVYEMALGRMQLQTNYIFFFKSLDGAPPKYEVMLDGTMFWSEENAARVAAAIELSPKWQKPVNGLATIVTADKFRIKANEELNFYAGYKNVSKQTITLSYRNWPLETHTYWALDVKAENGDVVSALPHPTVTREEANDYFSRFPHTYQITLQAGEERFYGLRRVNSAKPGWGHKEELDFKFYPMTKPGKYVIAATAHNLRDKNILSAEGLTIWVE